MSISTEAKLSPMMEQWEACKKKTPGTLLLFRLGDFYEAFGEDAALLAKELDLTLTKRHETAMAGVPFHASEAYIDRLVNKGYRVAIAEQIEDPKLTKGLVKREVVRVVTPGTVVASSLLSDKANNFLACIAELNSRFGLAVLDLTTADFRAMEFEDKKQLFDELCRLRPKEIVISEKCYEKQLSFATEIKAHLQCTFTLKRQEHFDHRFCLEWLTTHFRVHTLDGFGLKGMIPAMNAGGALLAYVREDLNLSIAHIKKIQTEYLCTYMALDKATQKHLELTFSLEGERSHSLLNLLDKTATPMGGRLLKQWLTHPLLSPKEISKRQDAIDILLAHPLLHQPIRLYLQEIRDLERLMIRIETGFASPKDVMGLRFSLEPIPPLFLLLNPLSLPFLLEDLSPLSEVSEIIKKIRDALVDDPPLRLHEGDIFKAGYSQELDALRALKSDSHAWISQYQTHLRELTSIKTLKVGFTRAFGYFIEVGRGHAEKILPSFERRQTLVNAERFTTAELKEYEYKVLSAEERILALESELFHSLRKAIAVHAEVIRNIATSIAQFDCLFSLAEVAKEHEYVRPQIDEGAVLHIVEGRHPVIEASIKRESFIPNDVSLGEAHQRLLLITGPNMAGKSTYIRQVALIVIMAQMGSFVPAKSAHLGIVDKVFTRIGASDDLARGQSTFMVEMAETANILHNATSRSLVILDEIGRGTSTYDGISIAWAVAEYLLTTEGKSPKTLFATHYWELTHLETEILGAINYNVAVYESEKGIVFLRKIVRGGTNKSYGIHVAKLAGLPQPVIKRAEEMLAKLEKNTPRKEKKNSPHSFEQLSLSF